ncbi:hypothetical protein RN001_016378 [Aquatica leii]|uniref:Aurora kinase n=1 Tax=Aquatica leii TaxID=1421715 RepID=A0AAN7PN71_9COLE|nr:hypothetical protein RN001_016378 [Aquatica leii]
MAHKNVAEEVEKCLSKVEIPEEDYEESKLYLTNMLSHEAYNNENYNWSLNNFELGTRIGRGKLGRVFIAREKQTGYLVALKTLLKKEVASNHMEQQVLREIEIQSHLKHKNILELLTWFHDDFRIYLVLEYAGKGELYEHIRKSPKGRFNEDRSSKYIFQVASALDYCHCKKVIHHYVSPEIIEGIEYGPHVDNWSLGILCYEFLVGKPPFESKSDKKTFVRILNVDIHYPCYVSAGAMDLISKLLRRTSEERITLSDVMQHPWIINNK